MRLNLFGITIEFKSLREALKKHHKVIIEWWAVEKEESLPPRKSKKVRKGNANRNGKEVAHDYENDRY